MVALPTPASAHTRPESVAAVTQRSSRPESRTGRWREREARLLMVVRWFFSEADYPSVVVDDTGASVRIELTVADVRRSQSGNRGDGGRVLNLWSLMAECREERNGLVRAVTALVSEASVTITIGDGVSGAEVAITIHPNGIRAARSTFRIAA